MATAKNLGDFFTSSKKKKKVKPTNLNAPKEEEEVEKPKKKDEKKDGEWDETESKEPVPKAELGNLAKEEEEDATKPRNKQAWSTLKAAPPSSTTGNRFGDMKKFPSLAVSASGMPVGTIIQDDVFEKGKKNLFAGLEEPDSDDDKPARQQGPSKKRGEKDIVTGTDDAPLDKEAQLRKDVRLKKKEEKNEKRLGYKASRGDVTICSDATSDIDLPADCLIPMDGEAAKKKYEGRRKLPVAELAKSELKEDKVQRKRVKVNKVVEEKKPLFTDDAW